MSDFLDKLCPRAQLAARVAALPRPIVFTNGVFDILHRGHVSYLAQARALGASLVIGLNSDASARGLGKGPDRPLNAEADRACVLAALESVSLVTLFDEPTPVELLKLVRPQLYVKGGDYDIETLEETKWVIPGGGSPDMGTVSADGKMFWVSGRYHHVIYGFDTATGKLVAKIKGGRNPHGLCVWPQPGRYSTGHTGVMR
jgi:rfaE bifunctional protein nucleotidyltransferase chain/domain